MIIAGCKIELHPLVMHNNLMVINLETCAFFTPTTHRYICYVASIDDIEKLAKNPELLLDLLSRIEGNKDEFPLRNVRRDVSWETDYINNIIDRSNQVI